MLPRILAENKVMPGRMPLNLTTVEKRL